MRVIKLEANVVVVPLLKPISFATRVVTERHYLLVRILTECGAEGIGFSYIGNKGGELGLLAVRDLLKEHVLGEACTQVEKIWENMFKDSLLHGRKGVVMRAISAIDIALWDVSAKLTGLPLYRYLGGDKDVTIPAYASGGYYSDGKSVSDLEKEVGAYVDMGFSAVKIKVGRLSVEEDSERIDAVRSVIGQDAFLFLDVNNAWSDVPNAINTIRKWEKFNPGWVEEPVMPDDINASAQIADAVQIPIATGEIENGRWSFKEILDKKAASILQTDAGVCGGITEWKRIAHMADGYGISISPHWLADLHVHLVASTPNATWIEYFTDTSILNIMELFSTNLELQAGKLVLPDRPGIGIELDRSMVDKYSVSGWK